VFPDAIATSEGKGVWKRRGRRRFDYTIITYAIGESGAPVGIIKNSGIKILSRDCQSMEITSSSEFFAPDKDPLCDEAFLCIPYPPLNARRITVDPPCAPPPH
jgi:hypothetical protein